MFSLNKKGISNVVVVIAVIIVGVVLILFSTSILSETNKYTLREACQQSVRMVALSKTFRAGLEPKTDLNCGTFYLNLDTETKAQMLEYISDEMFWCYWEFGASEIDFFSDLKTVKQNRCYVCSQISFSDEARQNYPEGIKMNELLRYMNNHLIPIGGDTYSEYISGEQGFKYPTLNQNEHINYSLDKTYWVVFHGRKNSVLKATLQKFTTIDAVWGGGVLVGAAVIIFGGPVGWGALILGGSGLVGYGSGAFAADRFTATVELMEFEGEFKKSQCSIVQPFTAYEAIR